MIPTFNCATYLRKTLASVLAQDPGSAQMQIEVVDDCSTKDDPEAVVREVSPDGRVSFYRQPVNVGAIANFNTCAKRSRGHLVHILHGDDFVEHGFYQHMADLARAHESTSLFVCRAFIINEDGAKLNISTDIVQTGAPNQSHLLWYDNPIATPAAVVRRKFYESHGGFDPTFPHVADWEMWWRAARVAGMIFSRQLLACYRVHSGNDTSRLARTAGNLYDYLRLGQKMASQEHDFNPRELRRRLGERALQQAAAFSLLGQTEAVRANRKFFWKVLGRPAGCLTRLRHFLDRRLQRAADTVTPSKPL
ncbi:MAG TPA: glycosyltransferase [Rariglobus sp.]|nr:glycosyltransferase [Rariglobus sp.]